MLTLDWTTGELQNTDLEDNSVPWSIVIAGDWAPMGSHIQALIEDPTGFYGDFLPVLRDADLSIVNVECVLGNEGTPIVKDGWHMHAPVATTTGLTTVPFKLACLANNHSMDYGPEGLTQTTQLLQESNIPAIGAGLSKEDRQPFFTTIKGVRVVVINVAEGEEGRAMNGGPGVAGLSPVHTGQQIADLRHQVDVVIVVVHAGREYVPAPPPYIHRAYRALVDAGADIVVGHHPHVPQGVEIYRNRPIVYSLGNFAFWIPDGSPYLRLGYLFKAEFRGRRLRSARLLPYQIKPGRLQTLTGEERYKFLDALEKASMVLATSSQVEAMWDAYADHWYQLTFASEVATFAALLADERTLSSTLLARLTASSRSGVTAKVLRRLLRVLLNRLAPSSDNGHSLLATDRFLRGAAILRNRFDTPAHRELYLRALGRVMHRENGTAPTWAVDLLREWEVT